MNYVFINAAITSLNFALWASTGFTSALLAGCFILAFCMFLICAIIASSKK